MTDQPERYAKQDEPWPEDKLPKGTSVLTEQDARNMLRYAHYRPATLSMGDVALDVEPEWSKKHANMIIKILWEGIKVGSTLFVPPSFPVQPPASAKRAHLEGFKQYTK